MDLIKKSGNRNLETWILGILGTVYMIRGLHEPLSEKKVIAITVNLAMVVLMAAILISNTLYRL